MNKPARKIVRPAAAVVAAAALSLSACSTDAEQQEPETQTVTTTVEEGVEKQTPTSEPTSATTSAAPAANVRKVDYDQLQQVSLEQYTFEGSIFFQHNTAGVISDCFANTGVVTCFGTPDASVPDVDVPPFSGRPGAVQVGRGGLAYTIVEGLPTAQAPLKVGQWVNFGGAKCAKPDSESLVCESDTAAFELTGEKLNIAADGPVVTPQELMEHAKSEPGTEFHTGTDVLVRGRTMCGAMEGHRLAEVMEGEITCAEAMDVLDRYDARKFQEGTGNTAAVTFDGWVCSSPSYNRMMELRASTVCSDYERGITIHNPNISSE